MFYKTIFAGKEKAGTPSLERLSANLLFSFVDTNLRINLRCSQLHLRGMLYPSR